MATGRIQNRELLARFADLLDLEGTKRFPAILDLGDIKVVLDISDRAAIAAPGAGVGAWSSYESNLALGGNSGFGYYPVLQGAETGHNAFRVDSLVVEIVFSSPTNIAAYITANGVMGIVIGLKWSNGDPGHSPVVVAEFLPVDGQLIYRFALGGSSMSGTGPNHASTWPGIVPAVGDPTDATSFIELVVSLSSYDSVLSEALNFPADTQCNIYTTAREGTNGVPPNP